MQKETILTFWKRVNVFDFFFLLVVSRQIAYPQLKIDKKITNAVCSKKKIARDDNKRQRK